MNFKKTAQTSSEILKQQSLQVSRITSCIAAILPLIAALGWILHLPILTTFFPSFPAMQPNTCVALVLGAVASYWVGTVQNRKPPLKAMLILIAIVILALGIGSLSEYLFEIDWGIDRLLMPKPKFVSGYSPGRPAPQTATNLIFLGAALLLYIYPLTARVGQLCALAFGANATIALTGSIFSFISFYGFPNFKSAIGMAIPTSVAFILSAISLICSHPSVGIMTLMISSTRSGRQAQRILLVSLIAPPVIGIITRVGVFLGWYGLDTHVALFSAILSSSLLVTAWRSARLMEQEELLAKSLFDERQIFAALVENSSDFIGIADPTGRPTYVNPAGRKMVGLPADFPVEVTKIPEYYPPEERSFVENVIVKSMFERGGWKGETYFRHWKTEKAIPVSDEHFLILEPKAGRVIGMGTVTRDITEVRQAKQDLLELNETLERKVAERTHALAESERETLRTSDQLRFILEHMPGSMALLDRDMCYLWASQRWISEYGLQGQTIIGRSHYELCPQIPERWREIYRRCLAGAVERANEDRFERADGSFHWLRWEVHPWYKPEGGIGGIFIFSEDIEERMQAQVDRERHLQAIKSLNEQLEKRVEERTFELKLQATILSSMAEGVCLVKASNGEIVYANPKFEAMLGYERGELIGKPVKIVNFEQTPGKAEQTAQELMSLIRQKGSHSYDIENVRKNGQRIWCRATTSTFQHPNFGLVFVAVHEDITEKRIAENALRDSEQRFRRLFESAHDGILIVDDLGRICQANDQVLKMFGYQLEELLGKEIEILVFDPFQKGHVGKRMEFVQSPHARPMGVGLELYGKRKDGTGVPVDISLSPVSTSEGLRVTVIIRDITERREYEHKMDERARDLARSNAELEQFAYVTSHDLREPLRVVTNYAQLLERRYRGKLDESANKYIAYIVEGADRMYSLIGDLLTYSRVGRVDTVMQDVDLNGILEQVLRFLRVAIDEAHAKVLVEHLPTLKANATLMQQLMQNLISNAIKFQRKGVDPEIHVAAKRKKSSWVVSIVDNGIGIERQYWDRVFVIFQRLHGREEYPGTGIGLAICKKIVEYHGGKIWIESSVGQGTTFFFEIPETGYGVQKLQSTPTFKERGSNAGSTG